MTYDKYMAERQGFIQARSCNSPSDNRLQHKLFLVKGLAILLALQLLRLFSCVFALVGRLLGTKHNQHIRLQK